MKMELLRDGKVVDTITGGPAWINSVIQERMTLTRATEAITSSPASRRASAHGTPIPNRRWRRRTRSARRAKAGAKTSPATRCTCIPACARKARRASSRNAGPRGSRRSAEQPL